MLNIFKRKVEPIGISIFNRIGRNGAGLLDKKLLKI
jgi:hypothetical protein